MSKSNAAHYLHPHDNSQDIVTPKKARSELWGKEAEDLFKASWKRVKTFADPVYGTIELPQACVDVINTQQFTRLHSLKQTGVCHLVFPSASHSRFEHSLGTAHLAGKVISRLQVYQPEIGIDDRDVLSVQLAALCHDLGHGPLSHTFDMHFIPVVTGTYWKHETGSVEMFRHLLNENPKVSQRLRQILTDEDFLFIEEAIDAKKECEGEPWPYKGRPIEKAFMYDIVSNKRNGVDVDKWDYVTRDVNRMALKSGFSYQRLLTNIRVLFVNRRPTICFRDKVVEDLRNLGYSRAYLHTVAYQHHAVKAMEIMIVQAMQLANDYLLFPNRDGKLIRLSDTVHDMYAYSLVTDDAAYWAIKRSTNKELEPARKILQRVDRRELYTSVAQAKTNAGSCPIATGICKKTVLDVASYLPRIVQETQNVTANDLINNLVIIISDIHWGMKEEDPVEYVYFWRKREGRALVIRNDKVMQPSVFGLKVVRIFSQTNDASIIDCARMCFKEWCVEKQLTTTSDEMVDINSAFSYASAEKCAPDVQRHT